MVLRALSTATSRTRPSPSTPASRSVAVSRAGSAAAGRGSLVMVTCSDDARIARGRSMQDRLQALDQECARLRGLQADVVDLLLRRRVVPRLGLLGAVEADDDEALRCGPAIDRRDVVRAG